MTVRTLLQTPPAWTLDEAASAFRRFFEELAEAFLEREALFTQIELALLCREHVLVIGPPGTAKSAVASAVLSRILDERTGEPSLFAKQLSESTVQTDLIGPVDFKVLTETGRTEYLTEEGMLGATLAFLDEVFDGRDMLLRSILNVLHERELKHGRRLTPGRIETAIMTTNRYLSEVLERSAELLLAFADRLSFVCFVPKSFARAQSRAAMLGRALGNQRPELRGALSFQQLDVLQEAVEAVEVGSELLEGLELLADKLERALAQQVARQPGYVPTKYFSQRTVVKALWALKAAVVRDRIFSRPGRALVAELEDLSTLRHFFLLGGPPPEEVELLLAAAADPRERAQLEILRLEHRAFDEVLAHVRSELSGAAEREEAELRPRQEAQAADEVARAFRPQLAEDVARRLRRKLAPGPRHARSRAPLLSAARVLLGALEDQLSRGPGGAEHRGSALRALSAGLELCRAVTELRPKAPRLEAAAAGHLSRELELLEATASAVEYERGGLERLAPLCLGLSDELGALREVAGALGRDGTFEARALMQREAEVRAHLAEALATRARAALGEREQPPVATLGVWARRLDELEAALSRLSPAAAGLKASLLGDLAASHLRRRLETASATTLEQLAGHARSAVEDVRREGLEVGPPLRSGKALLERRVREQVDSLGRAPPPRPWSDAAALGGEAAAAYRDLAATGAREGDLSALLALERDLADAAGERGALFGEEVKRALAAAELAALAARLRFLERWFEVLRGTLPEPGELGTRAKAEAAFEALIRSRLPSLVHRDGELQRLEGAAAALEGVLGGAALALRAEIQALGAAFGGFSKGILEARATSMGR